MTHKFEYQVQTFFNHELAEVKIPVYLNEKGLERWELVNVEVRYAIDNPTAVNRRKFYFKRSL